MAHRVLVMVTPLGAGPCAPHAPLVVVFLQGGEVWGMQGPWGSGNGPKVGASQVQAFGTREK